MADPILGAKRGTLESFLADYSPTETPFWTSVTGQTALFGALANRDPVVRAAIANRLLDDGADASVITKDGATTLPHILLTQRPLVAQTDAPLLRRLFDGGAPVNLPDRKLGPPLAILYRTLAGEENLEPFYEVFFARPDLDLDAPASKDHTVRELILDAAPMKRPVLQELVRAHDPANGEGS